MVYDHLSRQKMYLIQVYAIFQIFSLSVAEKRGNKTGTMIYVALVDGEAEAEGHGISKYNFKAHV